MKNRNLYIAWAVLYVACAVLGFVPSPASTIRVLIVAVSLAFFVPPAVLLYRYAKRDHEKGLKLIRMLALVSLVASMIAIVLNFATVGASAAAGKVLYWIMIVVSVPMVSMQSWALSLFLWAILLVISQQQLKKLKK